MKKINTREAWLREATIEINRTLFKRSMLDTMPVIKGSNGEPMCGVDIKPVPVKDLQFNMAFSPNQRVNAKANKDSGKLDVKVKHIGLCYYDYQVGKEKFGTEIFITPNLTDPIQILGVLIHELIHAMTKGAGHKGAFRWIAEAVGLQKPMVATFVASDTALYDYCQKLVKKLGKPPHKKWVPASGKKQSTRMKKVSCTSHDGDEYIIYMSRTQMERGTPMCPLCPETMPLLPVDA